MTDSRPRDRRTDRGRLITSQGVIVATAVVGVLLLIVGVTQQQSAPQPQALTVGSVPSDDAQPTFAGSRSAAAPIRTPGSPAKEASPARKTDPQHHSTTRPTTRADKLGPSILSASRPTRLTIPTIEVDTAVGSVGLTSGGEVAVPSGKEIDQAAWFDESPTPGQYGASVIVGHIDSPQGPSVFYRLGGLKPGDSIRVDRADQSTATFIVDGIKVYMDRQDIPVQAVYGGAVDQSQLRLITCTNFDQTTGHYRGNAVVFAHLVTTQF